MVHSQYDTCCYVCWQYVDQNEFGSNKNTIEAFEPLIEGSINVSFKFLSHFLYSLFLHDAKTKTLYAVVDRT